eukprot:2431783-Prymnesium_polylepis.1
MHQLSIQPCAVWWARYFICALPLGGASGPRCVAAAVLPPRLRRGLTPGSAPMLRSHLPLNPCRPLRT